MDEEQGQDRQGLSAEAPGPVTPPGGSRWLRWLPSVVVWLTALVIHAPGILAGQWLIYRDSPIYGYPNELLLRQALAAGQLPHLNPHVYGGIPHLSDPATLALYPGTWLSLLAPLPWSSTLYLLAHAVLAGLGAAALARRSGQGPWGQALAGGALTASGYLLSFQESPSLLTSVSWLPLLLASSLDLARSESWRGGARPLACLAGATALCGMVNPVTALQGILWGTAFVLWPAFGRGWRLRLGQFGAWGVLAFLLSALLVVPAAVAWLPLTTDRAQGFSLANAQLWSTHPARALELFVPWPYGSLFPDARGFYGAGLVGAGRDSFLADTIYLGPLILLLAGLGLGLGPARGGGEETDQGADCVRARAVRWALAGLAGLGALLALGEHTPAFSLLHALPGLGSYRYPEKLLFWPTLAGCILAGRGLERALASDAPRWLPLLPAGGLGLVQLLQSPLVALASPYVPPERQAELASRVAAGADRAAALLALLIVALVLVRAKRSAPRRRTAVLSLVLLLTLGDLILINGQRRFLGERPFAPEPDTVAAARAELGSEWRLTVVRQRRFTRRVGETMKQFLERTLCRYYVMHGWYGLPRVRGFASWRPRRLAALDELDPFLSERILSSRLLSQPAEDPPPPGAVELARFPELRQALLRFPDPLPYAYWLPSRQAQGAADPEAARQALAAPGFDPQRSVVLEGWQAPGGTGPVRTPTAVVSSRGPGDAWRGLDLEVELDEPGVLVVAQQHWGGWSCRVDGAPARVYPANALTLGIPLPAGRHQVELRCSTPGLGPGLALSLLGLLGLAALVWSGRGWPDLAA